jgi:hypothetical protein
VKWVLVAASLLVPALAPAATAGPVPAAHGARCAAPGSTRAVIGGRHVCLRDGARCRARFERQYRRHVFTCRDRELTTYWRGLRRAFRAQPIATGSPCPTSEANGPLGGAGVDQPLGALPAWGPGPAYAAGLGRGPRPKLVFEYPPPAESGWEGSGWGGNKNIWVVGRWYHGPVLVRGRRLDGEDEVRFENGRPAFTRESALHPSLELRLTGPEAHGNPSTTRVRAPGCYTFQVDGRGFSYAIVFEAELQHS